MCMTWEMRVWIKITCKVSCISKAHRYVKIKCIYRLYSTSAKRPSQLVLFCDWLQGKKTNEKFFHHIYKKSSLAIFPNITRTITIPNCTRYLQLVHQKVTSVPRVHCNFKRTPCHGNLITFIFLQCMVFNFEISRSRPIYHQPWTAHMYSRWRRRNRTIVQKGIIALLFDIFHLHTVPASRGVREKMILSPIALGTGI